MSSISSLDESSTEENVDDLSEEGMNSSTMESSDVEESTNDSTPEKDDKRNIILWIVLILLIFLSLGLFILLVIFSFLFYIEHQNNSECIEKFTSVNLIPVQRVSKEIPENTFTIETSDVFLPVKKCNNDGFISPPIEQLPVLSNDAEKRNFRILFKKSKFSTVDKFLEHIGVSAKYTPGRRAENLIMKEWECAITCRHYEDGGNIKTVGFYIMAIADTIALTHCESVSQAWCHPWDVVGVGVTKTAEFGQS